MIGTSTYAIGKAIGDWGETEGISKGVQIIDISSPANIVAKDEFTNANLVYPGWVETFTIGASTYAIVTQPAEDKVTIYDVSDPTNIVVTDADTVDHNRFTILDWATGVNTFVLGTKTYAIVT